MSILATIEFTTIGGCCKTLRKRFPDDEHVELYLYGLENRGLRGKLLDTSHYVECNTRKRVRRGAN